jgi:hypothetical protein
MVDLETATTRLYEETNLTDELVDQDATTLLKWAEQQVADLVAKYGSDENAFETAFTALRSLLKNMNRYVGQGDVSNEAQQAQRMENITQSASEIGFEMTPTFGAQSLARGVQSKSDLLQSMLSSLQKTGDAPVGDTAAAQSAGGASLKPQTASAATASADTAGSSDPSRHTRRMTLQPSNNQDAADLLEPEPQEITEDRVVNVFTVPQQDEHDETEDTSADDAQDDGHGLQPDGNGDTPY